MALRITVSIASGLIEPSSPSCSARDNSNAASPATSGEANDVPSPTKYVAVPAVPIPLFWSVRLSTAVLTMSTAGATTSTAFRPYSEKLARDRMLAPLPPLKMLPLPLPPTEITCGYDAG